MPNNKGPWATPRSFYDVDDMLKGKSEVFRRYAREHGITVHEVKLINGGPEFEVLRPPVPTYEQAIVHMYREAKDIVEQGERLKQDWLAAKNARRHASYRLLEVRMSPSRFARINPTTMAPYAKRLHRAEQDFLDVLDKLWEAQEKYTAWAKLYGDI